MPRIEPLSTESASPKVKKILEGVKAKFGKVPNIFATIAHSPITLESFLSNSEAFSRKISLTPREMEGIALTVGEHNGCHYCVSAHTVMAKMAGFSLEEALELREGKSRDVKLDALVKFTDDLVDTKGHPSDRTVEAFFKAGYSEAALIEVIAWVAHNIFTNYFNNVNKTEIDFPKVQELM